MRTLALSTHASQLVPNVGIVPRHIVKRAEPPDVALISHLIPVGRLHRGHGGSACNLASSFRHRQARLAINNHAITLIGVKVGQSSGSQARAFAELAWECVDVYLGARDAYNAATV